MRILLDTQVWLWTLIDPDRLGRAARDLFEDHRQPLYLSAASSWEIAIKVALGRLELPEPPERYVPARMAAQGVSSVAVEHVHALRVASLPQLHGDPFDRVLIAQAQVEKMAILTADAAFSRYDVEVVWAGAGAPPLPRRPARGSRRR